MSNATSVDRIDCEFRVAAGCRVAGGLCGVAAVPVSELQCRYCLTLSAPGPKQVNSMTAGLALVYKLAADPRSHAGMFPELAKYLPQHESSLKAKALEAARLAAATATWAAAGFPVRSAEEIRTLFYDACLPCRHYRAVDSENGKCLLCGCNLNPDRWLNKLRWATESCPDDPPRFVATAGPTNDAGGAAG